MVHDQIILSISCICHDVYMSYVYYNPNPCGRAVGDCSVRAISKALDISWHDAYLKIVTEGYGVCDMPSSDAVWGAVLRQNGFVRKHLLSSFPSCYTAMEFCRDFPEGTYVLAFGGHVATVVDGRLFDAWNSSNEQIIYYWQKEK